jgi:hypothetical protein
LAAIVGDCALYVDVSFVCLEMKTGRALRARPISTGVVVLPHDYALFSDVERCGVENARSTPQWHVDACGGAD